MGGLAIAITEDLCIVSIVQIKSQLGTGLFISFVICDLIFIRTVFMVLHCMF